MLNKQYLKIIPLVLLLTFFGCSDDPSSLGVGLLGPDNVDVMELNSLTDSLNQESHYVKKIITLGTAQKFLLGSANGITAHALIRFNISLTADEKSLLAVDSLEVVSAIVSFYPVYQYGDSTAFFDFKAYQIKNDWNPQLIKVDSLSGLDIDSSVSRIKDGTLEKNDSLITFSLKDDFALQWLKAEAAIDTNNNKEYGLYIKPETGTNKILGFQAFSSTSDYQARLTYIMKKKGEADPDTVVFYVLSDTHILLGEFQQISNNNILVQGGIGYKSRIHFDLSKLPAHAVINSATLILNRDSVETLLGNGYTNALSAFYITDTTATDFEYDNSFSTTLSPESNQYSGSVISIVNKMIKNKNSGFGITIFNQVEGVERIVFHGSSDADLTLRPKLIIKYSINK
ncbi:MAG: DNRLRE domain-containing protein [Ignavibacteria bacterium]|nr:DNRLRE domain-containing protein [Ignavibacteria bacterium]